MGCWGNIASLQEILNVFGTDNGTNISVQATEIAADIAVTTYIQTMTVMNVKPGFMYTQVRKLLERVFFVGGWGDFVAFAVGFVKLYNYFSNWETIFQIGKLFF